MRQQAGLAGERSLLLPGCALCKRGGVGLSEAGFAAWLRQHINLGGKSRVNEPQARYAR